MKISSKGTVTFCCIQSGKRFLHSIEKGANVLADAGADGDVEAAVGGDIKKLAACVARLGLAAVEFHDAVARNDLHALGLGGAEVEIARIDEPEGFLAAVREQDAVADDFAVEIDVGFGDSGDSGEFSGDGGHRARGIGDVFAGGKCGVSRLYADTPGRTQRNERQPDDRRSTVCRLRCPQ